MHRGKSVGCTSVQLQSYKYGFPAGDALRGLGHAVLGWAVLLPFIMIGLTVVFKPILTLLQKRCGQHPALFRLQKTQTGKRWAFCCAARPSQLQKPEKPERMHDFELATARPYSMLCLGGELLHNCSHPLTRQDICAQHV